MNYNYHTHTFRCGHAKGTEDEYIKRAIENGIEFFGFSDHAPFISPDNTESSYRVPTNSVKDYFKTLNDLRNKYADKIDIKIGFEMEYYPNSFEKMLKTVKSYGAEYLILGEHFTDEEYLEESECVSQKNDSIKKLKNYVNGIVAGIETAVFSYVAHPDMINFSGDVSSFRDEMRKICIASKKHNIPLEINFLGIRGNRNYPNERFWEITGEENSPVTFGFDSHDVLNAYDGESLKKAMELVKKYNLNYIGKPNIILLNK